jgi:E3 ubiquitin-protein ligase HERC2
MSRPDLSDSDSCSSETLEVSSLQDTPIKYKTRDDFPTADQYALYVRSVIRSNMIVKCCQDFEEIRKGDIGKVIKIEPEGLHDLNVRVDWQMHDRPYWMCFVHLELLEPPQVNESTIPIVGSKVKIKNSHNMKYRLGTPKGTGTITFISGNDATVDFEHETWSGHLTELEIETLSMENAQSNAVNYDIIEDWSRCLISLSVSSNESCAKYLLDKSSNYWQSQSTQGKHWIRLELHDNIYIQSLSISVSPDDFSHMPSLVVIKASSTVNNFEAFYLHSNY